MNLFFQRAFIAQRQCMQTINPRGKKQGSVTYSSDQENNINTIFILPLDSNRGEETKLNKLLNLAGHTVKYSLLNWPIILHILTERYNQLHYCLLLCNWNAKHISHFKQKHVIFSSSETILICFFFCLCLGSWCLLAMI